MQYAYGEDEIIRLTGLKPNTLAQHRARGNLDPADLQSLLNFVARFGTFDVRKQLIIHALSREKTEISHARSAKSAKRRERPQ